MRSTSPERLRDFSTTAAAVALGLAAALAVAGQREAMALFLLAGVGANLVLGALWDGAPRVLGLPARVGACAWAAWGAWQAGLLGSGAALLWPRVPGWWGGGLLLVAAFLALDHFGSLVYRARRSSPSAVALATLLTGALGVALAAGTLLVAASFHAGTNPALRGLGLAVLGFGFVGPGALLGAVTLRAADAESPT